MTRHKFPLPLSSLTSKSVDRAVVTSAASVATPQTATQNVRQHTGTMQPGALVSRSTSSIPAPVQQHVLPQNKPVLSHQQTDTLRSADAFDAPRRAMVARLSKQGVKDTLVLSALSAVPRHHFIESGLVGQAYSDISLPIGYQQTISQPYIVARMIEIMRNGATLNNVLEIGTGCGYQAAVLAQVCKNIYSIERIKSLHELAKKNLRALRIANLRLHYGDGMHGLPQVAPFDGIILAAAGMQIPDALLQQLAIGGRLIAPVGEKQQVLQLIERTGNANWTQSVLEECFFVPLRSGII